MSEDKNYKEICETVGFVERPCWSCRITFVILIVAVIATPYLMDYIIDKGWI